MHDSAALITGFDLSLSAYGIAFTSSMCTTSAYSICEDTSGFYAFTTQTVAHELV